MRSAVTEQSLNFYKHHIGDFDQATRHLSFVEDAAYSRMIRKYYAEEKVLPVDVKKIERLIGARTKEEREAVAVVLEEFFVLEDDGWHNKRCDEELSKANAQADANRKIALAREAKKRERVEHEQSTNRGPADSTIRGNEQHDSWSASEHESLPSREPSQTPDTRHQTPDLKPVAVITHASGAPHARPSELSAAMRRHSIEAQPGDPRLIAAAEAGVTVATIEAACAQAKAAKPNERIPPNYVVTIAMNWTADAAAPRAPQARASPQRAANHHDERAHTIAVLTGRNRDEQPDEPYTIDAPATRIG